MKQDQYHHHHLCGNDNGMKMPLQIYREGRNNVIVKEIRRGKIYVFINTREAHIYRNEFEKETRPV